MRVLVRSVLFGAAAALVVASPAQAQFGGLIKRAAERAAGKAADKAVDKAVDDNTSALPGCTPTFDKETVELTGETLDKLLRGLSAQASAGEKAGRGPLAQERDRVEARIDDLQDDPSMARAKRNQEEWQECRMKVWSEGMQKKYSGNPMAMFAGDPDAQRRMRELNERAAAAERKGDTTQAKIIRDSSTYSYLGGAKMTAEDSLAAEKKCGKAPAGSKKEAELDSLRIVRRGLDDKIREIDEDNDDVLYKQSGLTRKQMAMARERIISFLASKSTPCGYSKTEIDAIRQRKDALAKLK
jgi:hypothetical protein